MSVKSVALVECLGVCNALVAMDAMSKAAAVELRGIKKLSGGFFVLCLEGELESLKTALDHVTAHTKSGLVEHQRIIAKPALLPTDYFL